MPTDWTFLMQILAYMWFELGSLQRNKIPTEELASALGYAKPGVHAFFYARQELRQEGRITRDGSLTDLGKESIPKENFSFVKPKTNSEMQKYYMQLLRKKVREGPDEKVQIIFNILSDGKPHALEEFTSKTGYANMKSKGLGYNLSAMEKQLKILEKTGAKSYRFTNKCFPEGRP